MIIDRDKHNKYVAGWKPNYTVPTNQGSSSGTNVTIVYGGGGSGSSTPVSSEAFSYYKVSDGENVITQEAKVQKDIANLSIIGDEGIKVELITDPTIFEASFTSTGINEGVYKISYGKVTTVVEQPTESETQTEEPTEPEVVITFPMTITYVSGEKIKAEQFDTLRLLNDTEEVATYPSSSLAIEGDADGILSISLEVYKEVQSVDEEGKPVQDAEGNPVMEKQGLYFNRILLTSQLENQSSTQAEGDSTEEEPQQPTYESLLLFDVVVNIDTVIKLSSDSGAGLWKLDDNGNIYTEYNAYSLKELSAYGPGEGEAGEGVGFLHELGDVSIPAPNEIPDNAILQYNIETDKWEAVEWSELDDTATREWVEQKFKDLINGAPADLDTLGEIAIVIQELQQLLDWFSFVDGRIRANYDFWGVGEVSAYGPASGSDPGTGGGAGYLYELGDVTINNDTLTDGQIIVWDEDSQMWVNVDFSGLDEGALALYLTQNKYATQGWVNSQLDPINNKLEEFQTTIDMINDMFEWDSGKIKAKATLYSVGEISAYGAGEGSSGIIGYLRELEDVLLTDLQDDQLLMYDATIGKWINVDKNSVGLNEIELEQYLTTHNYVTSNQVVPPTRRIIAGTGLTGGGALSSDVTLSLATSGVTSGVYTKVTVDQYGRVTLGALLVEDDIPNIAWSKIHSTPTTLAGYGITDAYTMQQSDERYVNVTGDIMTGNLILPTLQANTSIILGSVKLEYDSASNALKISNVNTQQVINLYATGEISAYGYNDGSSSTGGYLHELEDVTLSNPQNGQALVYNSSTGQWVNTTIQAGGIDEAALAAYLTNNQYATQQWVTSQNYLTAVSVDTISDLHSSWDTVLKAQKPAWLTTVSLATISDLHASWDALLKAAPTDYMTRWPGVSEVTGLQDALNLKLDAATFNDLFEKVEISTGVYAIRAKYGLYSNDWISAKGANPDAGGVVSGATDLDGLSDVTLTNMQNGQVLMYNGSQWVNSTLNVGLDETALAQYLTSHLYATQSWVNSQNYATEADLDARIDALVNGAPAAFDTLKEIADVLQGNVDSIGDILTALGNKADKTITITAGTGLTGGGNLSANRTLSLATVGTAGTYTKVTVDAYGRVTGHASLAATDIPNLPWSKITSGKPTTLAGYGITDGVNAVSVTGSGNAVTTANVSGHTLTLTKGSTFLLSSAYTAADVLAKLKTVDGSGSGLDADTLDGIHRISFDTVTFLGAASDYWYVVIGLLQITDYTTLGNMARGRLIATRQNGNNPTVSIYYDISTQYNTTNVKFGYLNLGEGTTGQPCTFTYNGKKWAGFVFAISSQYDTGYACMRVGVQQGEKSTPFLAHYYTTGENPSIINSEIYNSLSIGGDDIISNGIRTHNVVAQSSVRIGSGTISWDSTNNCFHFSHGLYSDSFVSAKGANSGSGGTVGGVTKLSDLSDVQLGTLATNQVLSWNGSKWVNKTLDMGLDETALAQYLTNNQYLTMPTGDGRYVKKAGDTMTGTLTVPSLVVSGSTATVSGNKVWHAGNDGSGSGLDADLLDGYQGSSYDLVTNLSGIADFGMYVIGLLQITDYTTVGNQARGRLIFTRSNGNNGVCTIFYDLSTAYNTTNARFGYIKLGSGGSQINPCTFTYNGKKWAGFTTTSPSSYSTGVQVMRVGLRAGENSTPFILRYKTSNTGAINNSEVNNSLVTNGSDLVETGVSTGIFYGNLSGNAATATTATQANQLTTARTINGTAFNGTSNIVTSYWGTARTLSLTGNATGSVSINGSANVSMNVNVNYATSAGNASTLGGTSKAGLFTALSSSNATNLSVTIGGTTKSITDLYANYAVSAAILASQGRNTAITGKPTNSGMQMFEAYSNGYPCSYGNVLRVKGASSSGSGELLLGWSGTNNAVEHIYYRNNRDAVTTWSEWRTLAFTTDNVASASRLQTSQKIWGQPFNGTAPVSGNMTGVGSITGSGNISMSGSITAGAYVYSSGWFQNQQSGEGLYNNAVDARWYANSLGWISDKKINANAGLAVTGAAAFSSTITASGKIRTSNVFSAGEGLDDVYGYYNCTRPNTSGTFSCYAFVRSGHYAFGLGYNSSNHIVLGSATGSKGIRPWIYITSSGTYTDGYLSAKGQNTSSDVRLKNILCPVQPSLKAFAKAPLFKFAWKSDPDMVEIGSSAQYWKNVLPDTVKERDGWLEMGYGNIALAGVITIARDFETLEQRVDRLEKENSKLKERIKELERRTV